MDIIKANYMTNADLYAAVRELNKKVIGSRILKIYQLRNDFFSITLRGKETGKMELLIEIGRRFNLTKFKWEKRKIATTFAMALRKYLSNGILTGLSQINFDRIVEITVEKDSKIFFLVLELFKDGNVVLTDHERKIIHLLTPIKRRGRELKRGILYTPPPIDKISILEDDFADQLFKRPDEKLDAFGFLFRNLNLGVKEINEALTRSGVNPKRKLAELSDDEMERVIDALTILRRLITGGAYRGYLYFTSAGELVAFSPFDLRICKGLHKVTRESFNEAVDEFFKAKWAQEASSTSMEEDKAVRIREMQSRLLKSYQEKAAESRKIAEVILVHLAELEDDISLIRAGNPPKHFHLLKKDTKSGEVTFDVEGVPVRLSLLEKISSQASRYFEQAKKYERKARRAREILKSGLPREKPETPRIVALKMEKGWHSKFRWFKPSPSVLIVGGRNKHQNTLLVKRYMAENDLFVHADVHGGSVFIVKSDDPSKLTEEVMRDAAVLAACYSSAWKKGFDTVDVYYVHGLQVSTSPPAGQYLPAGAFFISGKRNYLTDVPLRLYLHCKLVGKRLEVLISPRPLSSSKECLILRVIPGEKSKEQAIRVIVKEIEKTIGPLTKKLMRNVENHLRAILPSGGLSIIHLQSN